MDPPLRISWIFNFENICIEFLLYGARLSDVGCSFQARLLRFSLVLGGKSCREESELSWKACKSARLDPGSVSLSVAKLSPLLLLAENLTIGLLPVAD